MYGLLLFQSTLPTRGSDVLSLFYRRDTGKVSIHAPHEGERRNCVVAYFLGITVSIHAPHEGERPDNILILSKASNVSIHAPHEGERLERAENARSEMLFQSTLPTRGSDSVML